MIDVKALDRLRARVLRYLAESRPDGTCRLGVGRICELLECAPAEVDVVIERSCALLPASVSATATKKHLTLTIAKNADEGRGELVREIFDYWVRSAGRDPKKTKLTGARRRKIEARLNDGYDLDDLKAAIDGNLRSDFHIEGGYIDLIHALKNEHNVERFRDKARSKASRRSSLAARIRRAGR